MSPNYSPNYHCKRPHLTPPTSKATHDTLMCSSPVIEGGIIRDHLLTPKLWTCYIHQIQHSKCPDSRIVNSTWMGICFLCSASSFQLLCLYMAHSLIPNKSGITHFGTKSAVSLFSVSYVMNALIHNKSHIGLTHFTTEQICSKSIVCTLHEFCHRDSFRTNLS
jgi:hypothetical protein